MPSRTSFNQHNRLSYKPVTNMPDVFFGDAWLPMKSFVNDTFKLNVWEELLHYTVEVELPGAKKEGINLEFLDGRLTIGVAYNNVDEDKEKGKIIHQERRSGYTQRVIYLPDAKGDGVTATLKDGVLYVTVPKADTTEKIKIGIN